MDEIELVIRGKVQDWRFARNNAYLIYCSYTPLQHRLRITDVLPLPFDNEIIEAEAKADIDFYNQAIAAGLPTLN